LYPSSGWRASSVCFFWFWDDPTYTFIPLTPPPLHPDHRKPPSPPLRYHHSTHWPGSCTPFNPSSSFFVHRFISIPPLLSPCRQRWFCRSLQLCATCVALLPLFPPRRSPEFSSSPRSFGRDVTLYLFLVFFFPLKKMVVPASFFCHLSRIWVALFAFKTSPRPRSSVF